ncbi:methionine aminopeptidase 2-like protein [Geopyxis carbonaria]|nr:methionine aminopeptidase 2-like protein [Geopyxis carbonaria]
MGSKTPNGTPQPPSGTNTLPVASAGQPRGAHHATDGDSPQGSASDDGDGGEDGKDVNNAPAEPEKKKRKRNRKRNAKKGTPSQTSPPSVAIAALYPAGDFPPGQEIHNENLARTTGEEKRALSRQHMDHAFLATYRHAAEAHRQVRAHVRATTGPGTSLSALADTIDGSIRALVGSPSSPLTAGPGFPTGLSLNNCAAHWTPNPRGRDLIVAAGDTLKVDFGVHVDGWIVDSAFTLAWDPTWDPLLAAAREATETGVRLAGVDARMSELGAAMQEVMESYEVIQGTNTTRVRSVRNITGHNITRYNIHGGKSVPFIRNKSTERMEEGEVFAIETFGTTGRGIMLDDYDGGVFGYSLNAQAAKRPQLHLASARNVLKTVTESFGSLVWCRRYLEAAGAEKYALGLQNLVKQGIVEEYWPLCDVKGSQTAQSEHTILLRNDGVKEVVSRGDDY